jgi:hypothetical protein
MAHADLRNDELFVTTDWIEKDLPAQVPGMNFRSARPNRDEGWYGPLSWGCWVTLTQIFTGRLTVTQELHDWVIQRSTQVARAMGYRDAVETTEGDWDEGTQFDHLRPYQQIGTAFISLTSDGVLIADDMGTGKTPTTLHRPSIGCRAHFPHWSSARTRSSTTGRSRRPRGSSARPRTWSTVECRPGGRCSLARRSTPRLS